MQGPLVQKTPSLDSDRLPFHPKYLHAPGYKVMSQEEFRQWLRSDPRTPPMYRSQPVSSGGTRPVSPSSSNSAALHPRLSTEGHYTPITHPATPEVTRQRTSEVMPTIGLPLASSGHSPRSPFRGLLSLTPLVTQALITSLGPLAETSECTHSRQSSGSHAYHASPVVETSDIPEGLLPIDDS
jgi:hypothetical protein